MGLGLRVILPARQPSALESKRGAEREKRATKRTGASEASPQWAAGASKAPPNTTSNTSAAGYALDRIPVTSPSPPDRFSNVAVQRETRNVDAQLPSAAQRSEPNPKTSSKIVRKAATAGISSAGAQLPFIDRIQNAFGKHDLSSVRVHAGSEAEAANAAMGSAAYTMGEHIVVGPRRDFRTIAHEAAHVIQQRQGVALEGGVGTPGDPYERHADAVAAQVVQGRSVEGMFQSGVSGAGAPVSAAKAPVQHLLTGATAKQIRAAIKKDPDLQDLDDDPEEISLQDAIDSLKRQRLATAKKEKKETAAPSSKAAAVPMKTSENGTKAATPPLKTSAKGTKLAGAPDAEGKRGAKRKGEHKNEVTADDDDEAEPRSKRHKKGSEKGGKAKPTTSLAAGGTKSDDDEGAVESEKVAVGGREARSRTPTAKPKIYYKEPVWDAPVTPYGGGRGVTVTLGSEYDLSGGSATGGDVIPTVLNTLRAEGNPLKKHVWIAGHILNADFGGSGHQAKNLTALTSEANSAHKNSDNPVKYALIRAKQRAAYKKTDTHFYGVQYRVKVSDGKWGDNKPESALANFLLCTAKPVRVPKTDMSAIEDIPGSDPNGGDFKDADFTDRKVDNTVTDE